MAAINISSLTVNVTENYVLVNATASNVDRSHAYARATPLAGVAPDQLAETISKAILDTCEHAMRVVALQCTPYDSPSMKHFRDTALAALAELVKWADTGHVAKAYDTLAHGDQPWLAIEPLQAWVKCFTGRTSCIKRGLKMPEPFPAVDAAPDVVRACTDQLRALVADDIARKKAAQQ